MKNDFSFAWNSRPLDFVFQNSLHKELDAPLCHIWRVRPPSKGCVICQMIFLVPLRFDEFSFTLPLPLDEFSFTFVIWRVFLYFLLGKSWWRRWRRGGRRNRNWYSKSTIGGRRNGNRRWNFAYNLQITLILWIWRIS